MPISKVLKNVFDNKIAAAALVFLGLIAAVSIIGPLVSRYNYYAHDLNNAFLPPLTGGHIFGTDNFGRDLFIRVCEGARISFTIGITVAIVQTFIGVLYGCTAGIFGGMVDETLMRFVDILYSIPNLIIAVLLTTIMGRSEMTIIIALSITDWTGMARIMRGQTLVLREMEFVQAARILGSNKFQIIFRHIIPNCSGPILVNMMLSIPAAIFSEGFLSFLGLGIEIPRASWGTLANEGFSYISAYPWLIMIPLSFIGLTMVSFNILGDVIKNTMDSKA